MTIAIIVLLIVLAVVVAGTAWAVIEINRDADRVLGVLSHEAKTASQIMDEAFADRDAPIASTYGSLDILEYEGFAKRIDGRPSTWVRGKLGRRNHKVRAVFNVAADQQQAHN